MLPASAWSIVETIAIDEAPRRRTPRVTAPTASRRHTRVAKRWGHAR